MISHSVENLPIQRFFPQESPSNGRFRIDEMEPLAVICYPFAFWTQHRHVAGASPRKTKPDDFFIGRRLDLASLCSLVVADKPSMAEIAPSKETLWQTN